MTNVNIRALLLDSKNPRHVPIENQKEIINYLIENGKIIPLCHGIHKCEHLRPNMHEAIWIVDARPVSRKLIGEAGQFCTDGGL